MGCLWQKQQVCPWKHRWGPESPQQRPPPWALMPGVHPTGEVAPRVSDDTDKRDPAPPSPRGWPSEGGAPSSVQRPEKPEFTCLWPGRGRYCSQCPLYLGGSMRDFMLGHPPEGKVAPRGLPVPSRCLQESAPLLSHKREVSLIPPYR